MNAGRRLWPRVPNQVYRKSNAPVNDSRFLNGVNGGRSVERSDRPSLSSGTTILTGHRAAYNHPGPGRPRVAASRERRMCRVESTSTVERRRGVARGRACSRLSVNPRPERVRAHLRFASDGHRSTGCSSSGCRGSHPAGIALPRLDDAAGIHHGRGGGILPPPRLQGFASCVRRRPNRCPGGATQGDRGLGTTALLRGDPVRVAHRPPCRIGYDETVGPMPTLGAAGRAGTSRCFSGRAGSIPRALRRFAGGFVSRRTQHLPAMSRLANADPSVTTEAMVVFG